MAEAPEGASGSRHRAAALSGIAFALIVGLAGAGLSGVPALFLQSVFVGEAQRCIEAIEKAEAGGDVTLTCPDLFVAPPVWLPVIMVAGGAVLGAVGGLVYGLASPGRGARAPRPPEQSSWLPF